MFDKVFIHREATPVGPPWFEWFVARIFRKPIIFDFDDAIWLPNSSKANEKLVGKFKNHSKTSKICSLAQTVTVGNSFLANYARQFCNDVRIIPTTIETENIHNPELFDQGKPKSEICNAANSQGPAAKSQTTIDTENLHNPALNKQSHPNSEPPNEANGQRPTAKGQITIGWTGTHSTLKQLTPLFPTLAATYKEHPFRFLLIADQPPEHMPDFVEFKKWNKETEIQDLMEIDFGIMPLFDTEWEKGKCGFKALQYLALEKPAIVSGVGVNTEIIHHNQNGLICEPMEVEQKIYPNWKSAILELLQNPEKRHTLGTHGRQTVIDNYSVTSQSKAYKEIFEN